MGRVTAAATALFLIVVPACDDPPSTPNPAGIDPSTVNTTTDAGAVATPYRIALVMKTVANPFFVAMELGARKAERDLGVSLVVRTVAQETSVEQQIVIVEELTAERVDAIVIAPGHSTRLIPPLKAAQDAGVVVVAIDNRLDPVHAEKIGLERVPFISVDNENGAYQSVRALLDGVEAESRAVILEGIRGAANAEARRQGALRAFGEVPWVAVVASETANWKIDEGYDVTADFFEAHGTIDLVFAANDMMALGAVQYLQDRGLSHVRVAGYDALKEAVEAVRTGAMVATIDQRADRQGYLGVETAVRLLRAEAVPMLTLIDVTLVTQDTVR